MAKINLDFKFFFFLVGPQIGLNPLTRPTGSGGDGSGPRKKKKTRLVNGPSLGHGS